MWTLEEVLAIVGHPATKGVLDTDAERGRRLAAMDDLRSLLVSGRTVKSETLERILRALMMRTMDADGLVAWNACHILACNSERFVILNANAEADIFTAVRLSLLYNQGLKAILNTHLVWMPALERMRRLAAQNRDCRELLVMFETGRHCPEVIWEAVATLQV